MKEKIEEKLNENIERILNKEELSGVDVAILEEKLSKIKADENKVESDKRMKDMLELLSTTE